MKDTKTMPHNIEAEKSVLGAIFYHLKLSQQLQMNLVLKISMRKETEVFLCAYETIREKRKIDLTTVSTELAQINMMSKVGGNYLAELIDFTRL